jgi:hypothetical protein
MVTEYAHPRESATAMSRGLARNVIAAHQATTASQGAAYPIRIAMRQVVTDMEGTKRREGIGE